MPDRKATSVTTARNLLVTNYRAAWCVLFRVSCRLYARLLVRVRVRVRARVRVRVRVRRSAIGWCTQAGWCSRRQSTFPELDARSTGVHVPPCRAHHCPTTDGLGAIVTPAGWVGGRREGERGEWGGMPCRRVSAFYLSGWGGREERGQWRGCRAVAAPRPTTKAQTEGGSYT